MVCHSRLQQLRRALQTTRAMQGAKFQPYEQPVIIAIAQRDASQHCGGSGKGRNSGSSSTCLILPVSARTIPQGRTQATTLYIAHRPA